MSWQWPKVDEKGLARFVTREAVNFVKLPVNRLDLLLNPDGRRQLVEVIYNMLSEQGVRYALEQYHPFAAIQPIRTPAELLQAPKEGTCLDLATLFCGVCLGNELLPLLVVIEGHALAAVSLTHGLREWDALDRRERELFERPLTDVGQLRDLTNDGAYLAIECTGFAQSKSLSDSVPEGVGRTSDGLLPFVRAVAAGREQLDRPDRPFHFALDIAVAHYLWMMESVVHQIESKINRGDYVDRQVITNNILVMGDARALDEVLRSLAAMQGVDKQALKNLEAVAVPDHVSNQIAEVMAAQKEVAARGVPATPQTMFQLGMLAAYRRDYDAALDYFRQATRDDPEYSDAFEAIAWLQQSRATLDINGGDYNAAVSKLTDARTAAAYSDPLDPQALSLRGYIAKTLAQIAEAKDNMEDRQKYNQEAARIFEHVSQLEPGNASAQNGLGNVQYALEHFDAAIAAYRRAIKLQPDYTAAHHDLALAYESKMRTDATRASEWCQKALQAWRQTYGLAPDDPSFSADYILTIGQRISRLAQQCGDGRRKEESPKGPRKSAAKPRRKHS